MAIIDFKKEIQTIPWTAITVAPLIKMFICIALAATMRTNSGSLMNALNKLI